MTGVDKTCPTCFWHESENRMWCNNCEHNALISQWPHADNFDFWQVKSENVQAGTKSN